MGPETAISGSSRENQSIGRARTAASWRLIGSAPLGASDAAPAQDAHSTVGNRGERCAVASVAVPARMTTMTSHGAAFRLRMTRNSGTTWPMLKTVRALILTVTFLAAVLATLAGQTADKPDQISRRVRFRGGDDPNITAGSEMNVRNKRAGGT